MSRNKKITNQNLFNKIKFVALEKFQIPIDTKIRWLNFGPGDDQNISNISQCRERYFYTSNIHLHKFVVKEDGNEYDIYFIFGLDVSDLKDENIEELDLSASLSLIILSEEDITLSRFNSSSVYRDILDGLYKDNGFGYSGHDYQQIVDAFPKFSVIKNNLSSISTDKVALKCILSSDINYTLSHSQNFIDMCDSVLGLEDFPIFNIIDAILASRWENAFLSIYRCLEHYYPHSYYIRMKSKLGFSVNLEKFSLAIEETMDWRPKEELSLKNLLEAINDQNLIDKLKNILINWNELKGHSECSSMIYQMRNSIVHSRQIFNRPEYAQDNWTKICEHMLDIVIKCHNEVKAQSSGQSPASLPIVSATT